MQYLIREAVNRTNAEVVSGVLFDVIPDDYGEALSASLLQDNVDQLTAVLSELSDNRKLDSLVSALEANAFLADFQNCVTFARKSRIDKSAGIHGIDKADAGDDGVIEVQLAEIGTKVEDEFLTRVLKVAATQ